LPQLLKQGVGVGIAYGTLPSSSPARTLAFEAKLQDWLVVAEGAR
jgi:hypothetical protein